MNARITRSIYEKKDYFNSNLRFQIATHYKITIIVKFIADCVDFDSKITKRLC